MFYLAEGEGFEPPVPLSTAVFKTAVIDHSTILPSGRRGAGNSETCCKGKQKINSCQTSALKTRLIQLFLKNSGRGACLPAGCGYEVKTSTWR